MFAGTWELNLSCNKNGCSGFFFSPKKAICFSRLVGGFKHDFYFLFRIRNVILPIDELIFFKMVIAPVGNAETFSEISGESYGENGES